MTSLEDRLNEFLTLKSGWFNYDGISGEPYKKEDIDWFLENVWKVLNEWIRHQNIITYVYPIAEDEIPIFIEWDLPNGVSPSIMYSTTKRTATLHVCRVGLPKKEEEENEFSIYMENLDLKKIENIIGMSDVLRGIFNLSVNECKS